MCGVDPANEALVPMARPEKYQDSFQSSREDYFSQAIQNYVGEGLVKAEPR